MILRDRNLINPANVSSPPNMTLCACCKDAHQSAWLCFKRGGKGTERRRKKKEVKEVCGATETADSEGHKETHKGT